MDDPGVDPVLRPYLACADARVADDLLGELLQRHAAPLVRRVVAGRLRLPAPESEDLCAQVLAQLLARLRQDRADTRAGGIADFADYAAATARHACDHYLRARSPLRWRLRNRIVYALTHDAAYAVWPARDGSPTCGRADWRSRASVDPPAARDLGGVRVDDVRALLRRLFELAAGPLAVTDVVDAAAAVWDVPRHHIKEEADLDLLRHPSPLPDDTIVQRDKLVEVWSRIVELPLRQRHALLLNLRDDAITMFLTTGAASLRDIAAALELGVEEFASVWNVLPLADALIAERLGCTRQQVINLRMAARKRLGNRLGRRS